MKRLGKNLAMGAGLIGVAAALWLSRGNTLPWVARWLDVGASPGKTDYVLVLGGDAGIRPFVAAAVLRAGLAQRALISQVVLLDEDPPALLPPEPELCRRVMLAAGVPPQQLEFLGHGHRTTYDEACSLRDFLSAHPGVRVLVVTNDFHTRRARWTFRQVLGAQADAVSFLSAPTESFPADRWWCTEEGVDCILSENLRFLFYLFRYSVALRYAGLASLLVVAVAVWRLRRRRTARKNSVAQAATV